MWQEARKQEKKLRGILIDYKKRAERRQAYYTKMRMDPHQLMRLHGQKCKFHMLGENALSTNVDGQLVPWQGDANIMIDRFDVRANLDYIPENNSETKERNPEDENFERKCSYERYRTLVQIDATGAPEETYLKQLETEEAFGKKQAEKAQLERQKKASRAKAKIHYKYDESTAVSGDEENDDDGSDESDGELSDIDINVNVMELTEEQTNQMDALATRFGIGYGQYCKQLLLEKKEFEYVKLLEAEEEERSKMPGRKGKSARRCLRIKQKTMRGSPLSFAVQEKSPSQDRDGDSSSSSFSRSTSPVVEEKIEFITEFGGDTKVEDKTPKVKSTSRKKDDSRSRHSSRRSRSRSRSKSRRSRHRKSQSRDRYKSRSRSNDRHRRSRYSRSRSRDRSSRHARSRSRDRYSRHSRSAHRSRTHSSSHSRSSSHGRSNSRKHSWSSSRGDRSRTNSPKRRRPRSRSTERRLKEQTRDRSKSKSKSPEKVNSETKTRSPSKSRSRSHSRSPHRSITKRLSADKVKPIDKSKLTPREKMKLRMQKMLNKQIKVDKVEEKKKQLARDQELEERDIQIYEMSRMMRLRDQESRRRSPSPKGRMPSYDATNFRYKSRSRSPS